MNKIATISRFRALAITRCNPCRRRRLQGRRRFRTRVCEQRLEKPEAFADENGWRSLKEAPPAYCGLQAAGAVIHAAATSNTATKEYFDIFRPLPGYTHVLRCARSAKICCGFRNPRALTRGLLGPFSTKQKNASRRRSGWWKLLSGDGPIWWRAVRQGRCSRSAEKS